MTLSIRARLTLWYTAILTLALAAAAVTFYFVQWRLRLGQIDEELAGVQAQLARLVPLELDEEPDLLLAAQGALEDIAVPGRPLAVFDGDGTRLAGAWDTLPPPPPTSGAPDATAATVTTPSGRSRVRWSSQRHRDVAYLVGAAKSLQTVEQELWALRRALFAGAVFALALAAAGGTWIARGALRPLFDMTHQTRQITDRTPERRLAAADRNDELGQLARAFNDLLARLATALATQRRFMADASHELRTPVSVARAAAEVTLGQGRRAEDEYREALAIVAAQMGRLARIVDDMFLLARADAAGLPMSRAPLYFDELVAACVAEANMLGAPTEVKAAADGPEDLEITGDERLLAQMLMNLLNNAIRHAPPRSRVGVVYAPAGDAVEIRVTDAGSGIPDAERERIFERFVRLDASRNPREGAGLGLPIARAIAEAHGGTLTLAGSDASGSTFVARIPTHPSDGILSPMPPKK